MGGRQFAVGVDVKGTGKIEVKIGFVVWIEGLEGLKSGACFDECAAVLFAEWPANKGSVSAVEGGV